MAGSSIESSPTCYWAPDGTAVDFEGRRLPTTEASDPSLDALIAMGFEPAAAEEALRRACRDTQKAVDLLTGAPPAAGATSPATDAARDDDAPTAVAPPPPPILDDGGRAVELLVPTNSAAAPAPPVDFDPEFPPPLLDQLVAMGFGHAAAQHALDSADGNRDRAVELLLGSL